MWSNDIKCKYMFMIPLKNLSLLFLVVSSESEWQQLAIGPISGFRRLEGTVDGRSMQVSLAAEGKHALFMSERGESGHHAAHMAMYSLDRILGVSDNPGVRFSIKTVFPGIGIIIVKIWWLRYYLIFIFENPYTICTVNSLAPGRFQFKNRYR